MSIEQYSGANTQLKNCETFNGGLNYLIPLLERQWWGMVGMDEQ